MDADLLHELNPDKTFDKAGEAIVVANVRPTSAGRRKGKAAKIEVLKGASRSGPSPRTAPFSRPIRPRSEATRSPRPRAP